ncbi:MAG: helix-turn-helix domain-containing protein, partial [Ruminococcaceae bacterium]|nr:helix-turn-helix domain-containing protein [Oscillospiraceae bacterium]
MYIKYDTNQIENLLSEFYTLTKIKTVFFDSRLNVISAVPFEECSFCDAFSKSEDGKKKCFYCTKDGLRRCFEKNSAIIYQCHAGLIEAVAPVRFHDVIVGYIMLGQVLRKKDREENADNMIKYAERYMGDNAKKYFDELICKSETEIHAAAKIMESCVCYILMHNIIDKGQDSIVFELGRFIEENPMEDLSVDSLCRRFNISRNALYKISKTYFGMPIAYYVRKKRLEYAKKLIEDGASVTIAAEQSGFYDYGYFGKIFKNYFGKTPSMVK